MAYDKLLTIAIPTYNRCSDLKRSIEILLPQISNYSDLVDFIISDNCSTDGTRDYVSNLVNTNPGIIRYNINDKNLGSFGNFCRCVDLTKTEYLCLLGDDDIVAIGFIATVLELLKKYKADILHYNSFSYKENANLIVPFYSHWNSDEIVMVYSKPKDFINTTLDGPSFMSSLIFKRKLWNEGTGVFLENCYGYDWFMRIYAGLKDDSCCVFYSLPLVTRYVSASEGYSQHAAKYYFIGLSRLFQNVESKFPGVYETWKGFQDNNLTSYNIIMDVLKYRSNYETISNEMNEYLRKRSYRFLFNTIIKTPYGFCKLFICPIVSCYVKFNAVYNKFIKRQ